MNRAITEFDDNAAKTCRQIAADFKIASNTDTFFLVFDSCTMREMTRSAYKTAMRWIRESMQLMTFGKLFACGPLAIDTPTSDELIEYFA